MLLNKVLSNPGSKDFSDFRSDNHELLEKAQGEVKLAQAEEGLRNQQVQRLKGAH